MVGLTRFFGLMNLCEKSGVSANVYAGFGPLKKDGNFRGVKKLFVLQEIPEWAALNPPPGATGHT
jgi:hypothetical protein